MQVELDPECVEDQATETVATTPETTAISDANPDKLEDQIEMDIRKGTLRAQLEGSDETQQAADNIASIPTSNCAADDTIAGTRKTRGNESEGAQETNVITAIDTQNGMSRDSIKPNLRRKWKQPIFCEGDATPETVVSSPGPESETKGSCVEKNSLPKRNKQQEDRQEMDDGKFASVPVVRVFLLRSVNLLPLQSKEVLVKIEGSITADSLLLEREPRVEDETGLEVVDSLIPVTQDGVSCVVITNQSGFTQTAKEGFTLGMASQVTVVSPDERATDSQVPVITPEEHSSDTHTIKATSEEHVSVTQETIVPDKQSCNAQVSVLTLPITPEEDADEAHIFRVEKMSSEQKTVERFQKLEAMLMETDLPDEHKRQLFTLLKEYHNIFSLEDGERGETDLVELHIDTADTPPSRQRARRMPFAVRKEVAKQLKMMQNLDVIQPSCSPWASPVVLVRKKDGSHRFCVDYRELNSVTRLDSYPLPRIDDLLDQLDQAHYFTTLDLASGYWQIRVQRDSVPKTAFATPHGLFKFRVMPFGLTNAPSVFQRLMQRVLAGLNPIDGPSFVSVYIDDVLVYSRTMEEHLVHLRNVLERLQKAGLKLKPNKCHFVQKEVEYLGHLLTPHGLSTNSRLVTAVKEFPVPLNVKETRRFLGLSSFYRRFIPFFSRVAQPLHQLTKKGARFEWTDACRTAFETLKTKLCEAPVLCFPSFQRDFDLEMDASIDGIGAVLSQTQEDGCRHPVAYASRSLSTAECNYAITDLETLAVVWALTHFRCYLYGHAVTVYTDHSAVRAVLETPSPSGRHARWWTRVYGSGIKSIKIVYRPGKSNMNADALSRCPVAKAPAEGVAESELQVAAIQSQPTQPDMNIPALLASDPVVVQSESILSAQRRDTELLAIVKYLENKQLPSEAEHARRIVLQSPLFSVIDGILYFIDIRKGGHQRAVVPRHLRSQLMEEHHKGPMGSHFSGNKLFKTMSHH